MENAIVMVRCPDRKGLIARITGLVSWLDGNIVTADQYTTALEGGFFYMRLEFCFQPALTGWDRVESAFAALAVELQGECQVHSSGVPLRVGILVSKQTHCLADVLFRQSLGELPLTVAVVVGNHPDGRALTQHYGVPFVQVPATRENRAEAEAQILRQVSGTTDCLVLARYMQVLTGDFLQAYGRDVINIHHSFLPSFKGARPYEQAWERGVKVIGATAHFVTEDLDEGPIIEQQVQRISHRDDAETLKRKGRTLEQVALAAALEAYARRRVFRHGIRTIVFD
jgi:formyltetrahydrofolate deformylase